MVVTIAVRITINSGMLASLVNKPINTREPQAISKVPAKCAVKSGYGNCARLPEDAIYLRHRDTITHALGQYNLLGTYPPSHPPPCVKEADFRVGNHRRTRAARLPAERRNSEEHTSELQSLRHLVC